MVKPVAVTSVIVITIPLFILTLKTVLSFVNGDVFYCFFKENLIKGLDNQSVIDYNK